MLRVHTTRGRERGREAHTQTYRETDSRQTDRQTDRHTDRQTDRWQADMHRHTHRQTDRKTDSQQTEGTDCSHSTAAQCATMENPCSGIQGNRSLTDDTHPPHTHPNTKLPPTTHRHTQTHRHTVCVLCFMKRVELQLPHPREKPLNKGLGLPQ